MSVRTGGGTLAAMSLRRLRRPSQGRAADIVASRERRAHGLSDLRIHRATAVLLLAGSLLIWAGATAAAEVVSRVAGAEGQTEASYGFDQVSTHCPTSVATRDTA